MVGGVWLFWEEARDVFSSSQVLMGPLLVPYFPVKGTSSVKMQSSCVFLPSLHKIVEWVSC